MLQTELDQVIEEENKDRQEVCLNCYFSFILLMMHFMFTWHWFLLER